MRIQSWNFPSFLPSKRQLRTLISFAALAVLSCATALAEVHAYNTIVVFGDSLSDTGNVLHLSEVKYQIPFPATVLPFEDYTLGRFTDGIETFPSTLTTGVWIEQLAATLPGQPHVFNSLDGGTNYAYGFATTANTSSPLNFSANNVNYSVRVSNIGQQITRYLATHPQIDNHTLFVVWGGAIDVLNAKSQQDIYIAAAQEFFDLQRLIQAGATQILVPNLPPLGLVPRLNGSPVTSVPATSASLLYNSYLAAGISLLKDFYWWRRVTFYQLDVFHLFLQIVASPGSYSLADVKDPAEGLPVNPDTFLFWDDLHPTTRGHQILADAALNLLSH
jgi:phospholipase/lecithinase/hemolysin